MAYAGGILWCGDRNLVISSDAGQSWHPVNFTLPDHREITSIAAYDASTCALSSTEGIYITHDQGDSWTKISDGEGLAVAFIGSPHILLAGFAGDYPYISYDDGLHWSAWEVVGKGLTQFHWLPQGLGVGSAYEASSNVFYVDRQLHFLNWGGLPQNASSFTVDTCDPSKYFVVSERNPNGIFLFSAFGASGTNILIADCSGSICRSEHAVYAQTLSGGIIRTTDEGGTWKHIGGPVGLISSRMMICLSDNDVIAVDPSGNIWRTHNSGGDSIPLLPRPKSSLAMFPDSVLIFGTLSACASTTSRSVAVVGVCSHPNVVRSTILGADASHFQITHQAVTPTIGDSVSIVFTPDSDREYNGNLLLQLDDGTTRAIALSGHGTPPFNGSTSFGYSSDTLFSGNGECTGLASVLIVRNCGTYDLVRERVTGADSARYTIVHAPGNPTANSDSIVIAFTGNMARFYPAALELTFSDGSKRELRMNAYGTSYVSLATQNVVDDTIGGTAYVPMVIRNQGNVRAAHFQIRYKPSSWAVFRGVYARSGNTVVAVGQPQLGIISVDIPDGGLASSDSLIGYAAFALYPNVDSCLTILFEAVQLEVNSNSCSLQVDSSTHATICTHAFISKDLNNGELPPLTIVPNPSSDLARIVSVADLGTVSIEVVDDRGVVHLQSDQQLNIRHDAWLDLRDLSSGRYEVIVRNSNATQMLAMEVLR